MRLPFIVVSWCQSWQVIYQSTGCSVADSLALYHFCTRTLSMPKNGHDEKHIDPYRCYISPGSGKSDKYFGMSVVCACSPGQLKRKSKRIWGKLATYAYIYMSHVVYLYLPNAYRLYNKYSPCLTYCIFTCQRQIFALRLRLSSWQFGGEECPNEWFGTL